MPSDATGVALIEVPAHGDRLDGARPRRRRGALARREDDGCAHGDLLVPAVRDWVVRHLAALGLARSADADEAAAALAAVERRTCPTRPCGTCRRDTASTASCYAWLAGEASVITTLRRFLVREAGLDRRQVAFMGYWRMGRAELD